MQLFLTDIQLMMIAAGYKAITIAYNGAWQFTEMFIRAFYIPLKPYF